MKPYWQPGILIHQGKQFEGHIQGTYAEKSIDANKQNLCRWEGDLTKVSHAKDSLDGVAGIPDWSACQYPRTREGPLLPG